MMKKYTSRGFIVYILMSLAAALVSGCGGGGGPAVESGNLAPVLMVSTFSDNYGSGALVGIATSGIYYTRRDDCSIHRVSSGYPSNTHSTLAGNGHCGEQDGNGVRAEFDYPTGIVVDKSDNLYVTDTHGHTIRKINRYGDVMTLAGYRGQRGSTDGIGMYARFSYPSSIALDASSNMYIGEEGRIRKLDKNGVVTTLAGPINGFDPIAIATDASGNVYATSKGVANAIYKFSPTGAMTTLALSESINGKAIAVDASNNVYVSSGDGNAIMKINPEGVITLLAGSTSISGRRDGAAAQARFDGISALSIDPEGNMYVADANNSRIRKLGPGYTLSGTVSGLSVGDTIILKDTLDYDTESLSVDANGNFTFDLLSAMGGNYAVKVESLAGQTCTVSNGTGKISGHVSNIEVQCTGTATTAYTLSGSVSGLAANTLLELKASVAAGADNQSAGSVTVTGNGDFAFPAKVAQGNTYVVEVSTPPSGQTCTVAGGSGTAMANVTNLSVTCVPNTYPITVALSGLLSGGTLAVQNNGADGAEPLNLVTNDSFVFPTQAANGSPYDVTLVSGQQPTGQACTLSGSYGDGTSGTVRGPVTILATCVTQDYPVAVTVMGLSGSSGGSLLLQNNLADDLSVTADGIFDFSTQLPYQSPYNVTISASPADRACTVDNGNGTTTAPGSMVVVTCFPLGGGSGGSGGGSGLYTISGVVNNLSYPGMELQNNGGDNLMLGVPFPTPGSLPFTFATPVSGTYSVTVSINPPNQTCTLTSGGSGTATGNVSNVVIDCN